MGDFEEGDDLYYQQDYIDDYEDYGEDEGDNTQGDFEEEDAFKQGEGDEDLDFTLSYKQMQQLSGDGGKGTNLAPGASEKKQKLLRTPEEIVVDQIRGILSDDLYTNSVTNVKKKGIIEYAETLKNVTLMNLEILVPAILWKINEYSLDKKNYSDFCKKYNIVDVVSLLTYIRMLS